MQLTLLLDRESSERTGESGDLDLGVSEIGLLPPLESLVGLVTALLGPDSADSVTTDNRFDSSCSLKFSLQQYVEGEFNA